MKHSGLADAFYITAMEKKLGLYEDEISGLQKELNQQRFNNKHNLSIDQRLADEIEALQAKFDRAIRIIDCLQEFFCDDHLDAEVARNFLQENTKQNEVGDGK